MGRAALRMAVTSLLAVAVATGAAISATPASAQDAAAQMMLTDRAVLGSGSGTRNEGRIAINIASGDGNQQLAGAVIANGATALGLIAAEQHQDARGHNGRNAVAVIESNAFTHSRGMISVNIAAGSGNQEANLAVIATGLEGRAASDAMLSQTRSSTLPHGGTAPPSSSNDVASLAPDAFAGSQGLVQVNLVGGERNSSANTFALNVSAGANQ